MGSMEYSINLYGKKCSFKQILIWISLCLCYDVNTSDGNIVYTQTRVEVTEERQVVLSCRYEGNASVVYWYKAPRGEFLVSLNTSSMARMITAPGNDTERFNITDDYSLVIRDVRRGDQGRYICEAEDIVSGPSSGNFTDVIVKPMVYTLPRVEVTERIQVALPCRYAGNASMIYWLKNQTSAAEILVSFNTSSMAGQKRWPGNDTEQFNITQDHSLVIKYTRPEDQGTYICEVEDFDWGYVSRNFTEVIVKPVVLAQTPFVRVEQVQHCPLTGNCTYIIEDGQEYVQLTCSVLGAKPAVSIHWRRDKWGARIDRKVAVVEQPRNDDTFDTTVTMTRHIIQMVEGESYTCVASGDAVNGSAEQTVFTQYQPINTEEILRIRQCHTAAQSKVCQYTVPANKALIQVDCSLTGAQTDDVPLYWTENDDEGEPITDATRVVSKRDDGMFDTILSLRRNKSEISNGGSFVCVAPFLPADAPREKTVFFLLIADYHYSAEASDICIAVVTTTVIVIAAAILFMRTKKEK